MAEQKTVATPDDRVAEMTPAWDLVRALLGGTAAMREAGQKYLPRWPKEEQESYAARLGTAVLFPATSRTVTTLAGKPFSKPLTIGGDVPVRLAEWCDDIDLEGRNLHAFASDCMEHAVGYGLGGILVEYPKANEALATVAGVRTMADEQRAGLRPYWIMVNCWQILGWRASREGGRWRLVQLRMMEEVEEPDGDFGLKRTKQVRVIAAGVPDERGERRTVWTTYRKVKTATGAEDWSEHETGVYSIPEIPFVPFYGTRLGFMLGKPPLLEVAHLNVAHWQSASDQQTLLHTARVPILCALNVSDQMVNGEVKPWEMTIGSGAAVRIAGQDADLKYVEHSGQALAAGKDDLAALEERMRQAGAELLVIDTKLTATQVASENAVGMCALQRIAQNLEDALDRALDLTAMYVGEQTGGHVTLFSDYAAATLQEASAELLLKSNTAGKLSNETLLTEYKRRGILGPEVDVEAELDKVATQGPSLGALGDPGAVGGAAGAAAGAEAGAQA